MNPTKKNLKLTKKTLFLYKKQSSNSAINFSSDPISITVMTPNTSVKPNNFE